MFNAKGMFWHFEPHLQVIKEIPINKPFVMKSLPSYDKDQWKLSYDLKVHDLIVKVFPVKRTHKRPYKWMTTHQFLKFKKFVEDYEQSSEYKKYLAKKKASRKRHAKSAKGCVGDVAGPSKVLLEV